MYPGIGFSPQFSWMIFAFQVGLDFFRGESDLLEFALRVEFGLIGVVRGFRVGSLPEPKYGPRSYFFPNFAHADEGVPRSPVPSFLSFPRAGVVREPHSRRARATRNRPTLSFIAERFVAAAVNALQAIDLTPG